MQFLDQNTVLEKSRDQVDDIIDQQYLSNSIPNLNSQLHKVPRKLEKCVVTSNRDFTCRDVRQNVQNDSINTLISVAEYYQKFPNHSEDKNKMQIDFHEAKCTLPPAQVGLTTTQKMNFSIKDFFSKFDQIHRKLRIWSHLLKKSLMEKFIFCAVNVGALLNKSTQ